MKKKSRLLLLVTLIAMLVLAACGGGKDSGSGSSEEGVTLKFVTWVNEDVGQWGPVIEKYEEENPGVKVEVIPLVDNMNNQDYLKQLDLMASAGEQVDLMMFASPNDHAKRIDAGLVAPISEFLDAEGIDIDEVYINSYGPTDDKYYGIPLKNVTNVVMMNKGHLEEAGLEIPTEWTWDEYRDYAKAMTTDEHYGSYFHIWHNLFSSLKLVSEPTETAILKEDGSSNADDPMLRASLEFRYQLEQEDKSSVPFFEIFSQKLDYRQQFFSEEVSMIPIASYMVTEWGQFTPDFEIAWAPWPQNEKGTNFATMAGDVMSVSQTSKHKQEAYDFMRWMTTEGIVDQGVWTPSWKEANLDEVLETLVSQTSKPDAIHMESLKNALTSVQATASFAPAGYITEVLTEFDAEVEMYLLGEQDIDTTMKNIEDKVQAVIDANQ